MMAPVVGARGRFERRICVITMLLVFFRTASSWTATSGARLRILPTARLLLLQVLSQKSMAVSTCSSHSSSTNTGASTPSKFINIPFEYHQHIKIRIETLTNRGWGIGRVQLSAEQVKQTSETDNDLEQAIGREDRKWVVMVPNVIAGELVRVRIFRNFKNYSEGDLVEILEPSDERVTPVCRLASDCGGCQFQHWAVSAQRNWKTDSVRESLQQYGLSATVLPTLGTTHVFGYRSKLTPHHQAPAKRRRGGPTTTVLDEGVADDKMITNVGFQRKTNRQIIDVASCPIATEEVNEKYHEVRKELLSVPYTRKKGATLLFRQGNLNGAVTTDHKEQLTTRVNGLNFTYLAGNFFQNNYHVLPIMADHVVMAASAPSNNNSGQTPMTHLVDCYCGSGLFAISAAEHFNTVVGIEINDKAVNEASQNAVANNMTNCQFRAATAETIFADIFDFPKATTSVILDPPRKGCSDVFLKQLYAFAPHRIVYLSCDPTTQARDAQGIVGTGRYAITNVQPFDLFPQTRHIECLMVFERQD